MPFSLVPFVLLGIPILEIAAFVVVGSKIGVLATLGLIFATAVLGSILLRIQGFELIGRIRREVDAGRVPGRELTHGVMLVAAAILLITPGFITDTLGFLLFIPAFRDLGWRFLRRRIVVSATTASARTFRGGFSGHDAPGRDWPRPDGAGQGSGPIIDLDASEFSDESEEKSPWRIERGRHRKD